MEQSKFTTTSKNLILSDDASNNLLILFGSDFRSLYTSWKTYLEEIDRNAKYRLSEFDQISSFCDQLKEMKSHKNQVAKRCLDQHLKYVHHSLTDAL